MTDHIHTEIIPGCFRCELSRDEAEAFIEEDRAEAQVAWLKYRDDYMRSNALGLRRASRQMRRREFIAGFMAGRRS